MKKLVLGRAFYLFLVFLLLVNTMTVVFPFRELMAANTVYYVDSVSGNDANNGLGTGTAWKTLAKVNATTFGPGDKILFKAGCSWSGTLYPKGSGASGSPIVIDMYSTGAKPLIIGPGTNDSSAVFLQNQEYWEINNLQVTNPNGDVWAWKRGIFITATDTPWTGTSQSSPKVLNHIYVTNCEVRNVDSYFEGMTSPLKCYGGIIYKITAAEGSNNWVKFNDIKIENNNIHDLSRSGVYTHTDYNIESPYTDGAGEGNHQRVPWTNVSVRNNYVADVGGDGLVLTSCDSPIMEYNVVARPQRRAGQYAVGIWTFGCHDSVIQYNESYGNQFKTDGQGFDSDVGNQRAIIQFNYSHDNQGGFVLVCSGYGRNQDTIVRYNISQNDGSITGTDGGRIFQVSGGGSSNVQIYNNTVYTATTCPNIVASSSLEWSGAPTSVYYRNNIIWDRSGAAFYELDLSKTNVFQNNCFYGGIVPTGSTGHTQVNPSLVDPGSGTTGSAAGRGNADGYKLASTSPLNNAGANFNITRTSDGASLSAYSWGVNSGKDNWGNSITGAPDIGANEIAALGSSQAALMIDDYNNTTQWNQGINDLGQSIIRSGGNYNLEANTTLFFAYDSLASFTNNINRSISGYGSLVIRISGESGGEQSTITVTLNDGTDHSVPLASYGTVTTSYSNITIPLSVFNANLANTKYLKFTGNGVGKITRIDEIKLQ